MDKIKIDVRQVPVDKLITFEMGALTSRVGRINTLLSAYIEYVSALQKELEETSSLKVFLEKELKKAELAVSLKKDDLVRVICPVCKGSGLKPTDVTSERIASSRTNSAFESLGKRVSHPEDNPQLQCNRCKGMKYIIMERYKS
ncbi:MAG: hypothetical protein PVI90_00125 [Desulfobacteraceae bacterium]|jgi:hypothetical protein